MHKRAYSNMVLLVVAVLMALAMASNAWAYRDPIIFCIDGISPIQTLKGFTTDIEQQFDNLGVPGTDYLANNIRNTEGTPAGADIRSFNWNGDLFDSWLYVNALVNQMEEAYNYAHQYGRPFIVVGHSWGTVLADIAISHSAYRYENGQSNTNMQVDLLMTLSSPMGTINNLPTALPIHLAAWDLINDMTANQLSLLRALYPPGEGTGDSVKKWVNIWSQGDMISGQISGSMLGARPENCCVDIDIYQQETCVCNSILHADTSLFNLGRFHSATAMTSGLGGSMPSVTEKVQQSFTSDVQDIAYSMGNNGGDDNTGDNQNDNTDDGGTKSYIHNVVTRLFADVLQKGASPFSPF